MVRAGRIAGEDAGVVLVAEAVAVVVEVPTYGLSVCVGAGRVGVAGVESGVGVTRVGVDCVGV